MKNAFYLTILFLFFSCSSDDNNADNCHEELGQLETSINGQTLFQARWTVFEYLDNGAILITSRVLDQNCLSTASISFTSEPILFRQNFTETQSFREPVNIRFWQINEDAILGKWQIVEGEPNWVQYDEITETSVKGRFQATLVIEENGNNFHTLPDTLRFDIVNFEAVSSELLNDR